ncbi:branched-chain amino acid ABC transporter permease [Candidatus Aerophobetes bacterium]|nr:branched-chain amino acid ABC transporter permease [Candidatus Aerophobetes bacterium]
MEVIKDIFDFKDFSRIEKVILPLFFIFLLIFPWTTGSSFAKTVMINFMLYSIFAMGWNSIGGYGGQVALGNAQYVGIGAYTVALFMVWWNMPYWLSLPVGVAIAIGWSLMIGYPLFRLRGHYFAIASIAVSLVLQDIFLNWDFVGEARGICLPFKKTPNFLYMEFTSENYYYYFLFAIFAAGFLYMNWFRKSKLAYQLKALKSNEDAADSLGVNIRWAKTKAYAITATFAAVGGSFYAVYNMYIDPYAVMCLDLSILIALTTMLGGAGSFWGPIIGAAILVPLDRYLGAWMGGIRALRGVDFMIYALIIMVIAAVEPRGIWGLVLRARKRR